MKENQRVTKKLGWLFILLLYAVILEGCATSSDVFRDPTMDFGAIKTVTVLPLSNFAKDQLASERVRDVFNTMLMSTGSLYPLPPGETARGISSVGLLIASAPTTDEIIKLGKTLKVEAVFTGVVREYGDVRSGSSTADVISVSMQLAETQTGRVVWSASTTQGGIGIMERLFGGGGKPLNEVTEKAVNDLINKLYE